MSIYVWEAADHVKTPDERADAIRQLESELRTYDAAWCWQACFDDVPEELAHRQHLRNLKRAIEQRIAELQHSR